jgi:hypothetical protein
VVSKASRLKPEGDAPSEAKSPSQQEQAAEEQEQLYYLIR